MSYELIKDLSEDIGERYNIADEQPERAADMYAAMTSNFKRFGWDESKVETAPQRIRKPKRKTLNCCHHRSLQNAGSIRSTEKI